MTEDRLENYQNTCKEIVDIKNGIMPNDGIVDTSGTEEKKCKLLNKIEDKFSRAEKHSLFGLTTNNAVK